MAIKILPPGSTGADLQAAIDIAVHGDVIEISSDMPFSSTVTVRSPLEVTVRSVENNNWVMYQFNPGKRHFEIDGSLILENIILDGRNDGGGVQLNQSAFAMLDGAVIQNCSAQNGGGVYVVKGVFSIYGGEIRNNTAQNDGGGVYINAGFFNMSAAPGIISSNSAQNGGGVYVNGGTYRLTGGEIINNEARNGGGLYINAGSLSMNRGNFNDNKAEINGGGIYVSAAASLDIAGAVEVPIANNSALNGNGGGIYTENTACANLKTGNVAFRCNRAFLAYAPPEGAGTLFPDIKFNKTTIMEHPLNNYDIIYTEGEPVKVTNNVTYNANGGTGSHTGPDIGPCETDMVLLPEEAGISHEGYKFTGWNTAQDGSGTPYIPGDEITLTGDMVLYAQWEKESKPPCPKEFCDKFCKEFCSEFCREFTKGCCRRCCELCCRLCYKICCKICCKICAKHTDSQ